MATRTERTIEQNQQKDKETFNSQMQGLAGLAGTVAAGAKQLGSDVVNVAKATPDAIDTAAATVIGTTHDGIAAIPVIGGIVSGASGAGVVAGERLHDLVQRYANQPTEDGGQPDDGKDGAGADDDGGQPRQLADAPEQTSDQQASNDIQAE